MLPFLRLGSRLKKRGHSVTLVSHCYYRDEAAAAGLDFAAVDSPEEYARFIDDGPLLNAAPGIPEFLRRHSLPKVALEVALIGQRCAPDDTVLVTRDLFDTAARIAAEKFGIPALWLFMAPSQLTTWKMRAELFAEVLAADIDALRAELALPPVTDWPRWLAYPQPGIAIWPDWFAAADSTWPVGVVPVGFVLDNESESGDLPDDVQAMLDAGPAPVLITPGTGAYVGAEFACASAEACRRLQRRAILVTRYAQQVPKDLPSSVLCFSHLPFGKLMPRVAAVIYHGGRGTLSCAIAAGVPQLVLAFGADRPDNAARLEALGVAAYLPRAAWRPQAIAEKLSQMIGSEGVRERCRSLADRVAHTDAIGAACELIEDSSHNAERWPPSLQVTPAAPAPPKSAEGKPGRFAGEVESLSSERRALLASLLKSFGKR